MPNGWGEAARLRAQHPQEPWLWRRDWADRSVRETEELGGWCLWGFTIVWNLFCVPLWFLVRWQWPMEAKTFLMAAFPVSGALLFLLAVYQTLRRTKYGVSLCRIERSPIPVGSTLRGELDVRLRELPPAGFALRLASVHRTVTGSGKNRSVNESILWQDEQTVTHGAMPSANGLRVPFRFDIPWDCKPCDLSNPSDTVLWRLHASAGVPGIDYEAAFELPVFRTEDAHDELASRPHTAASWQPPREITVGGNEIVVRSGGRLSDWIGYLLFFVIWYGALFLFRRLGAPLWVLILFGAFAGIFIVLAVDLLLGRTRLTADRHTLTIHRTWLGIGRRQTIPASDILRIEERVGVSVGNRAYHAVRAVLHDGRTRGIARHLHTRRDAEMLAAQVGQMLGV
jgi:hypothetical protein